VISDEGLEVAEMDFHYIQRRMERCLRIGEAPLSSDLTLNGGGIDS